jgi:hypothetical protein
MDVIDRRVGLPLFQMEEGMKLTSFLRDRVVDFPSQRFV